jgi:mannose-6-phosphate isomerase-like protein (cupin superfamily)
MTPLRRDDEDPSLRHAVLRMTRLSMDKVSLDTKFAAFSEHWSPKIVAELNGQHVKVVKFVGEFVWHHHDHEDEMFLVHRGRFRMELRDRTVELSAGDFIVIPRGVEHRPVADDEVEVVLFEPAGTRNTGNVMGARTVAEPQRL